VFALALDVRADRRRGALVMSADQRDLPPLPDTEDPFELLGAAPDAGAEELKRVYVERIKVYRPERAPDEFARLNAAFEQAMAKNAAVPSGTSAVRRRVDALRAGDPVAGKLLDEHDEAEIDAAVIAPGLTWKLLSEQP